MATSPYLTDQAVLNTSPEIIGLERQRKLAEALTSQAFNQPTGQMVSGHYVKPSWSQQLAPVLMGAIGQNMNQNLDVKQQELAQALRAKQTLEIEKFGELEAQDKNAALRFALSSENPILREIAKEQLKGIKLSEGDVFTRPSLSGGVTELRGAPKYHAPTSVDMGTMGTKLIYPDGRTEIIPKGVQGPAGQVVETANGPMLINTRTGAAQPIMVNGQPVAPKLTTEQNNDITAINQQKATINGALDAVKQNKDAFSFSRGAAQNMPYGETLAGRFDKPEQAQARAYVFNNVSAVIKERAGTAQSPSELQRINSFMPAVTDNAQQIENKLKGFNQYLSDLEKGTRVNPNIASNTQAPSVPKAPQNLNFDPTLLQFMTPEQRQLFGK